MHTSHKRLSLALVAVPCAIFLWACTRADASHVEVYKSATCRCCSKWIDHLRAAGFLVKATDMTDMKAVKAQQGVPPALASCHTAVVDGYVVEGHVPADVIHRLLRERPPIKGLAVPGMSIGSPGLEGPNPEAYSVVSFDDQNHTQLYSLQRP